MTNKNIQETESFEKRDETRVVRDVFEKYIGFIIAEKKLSGSEAEQIFRSYYPILLDALKRGYETLLPALEKEGLTFYTPDRDMKLSYRYSPLNDRIDRIVTREKLRLRILSSPDIENPGSSNVDFWSDNVLVSEALGIGLKAQENEYSTYLHAISRFSELKNFRNLTVSLPSVSNASSALRLAEMILRQGHVPRYFSPKDKYVSVISLKKTALAGQIQEVPKLVDKVFSLNNLFTKRQSEMRRSGTVGHVSDVWKEINTVFALLMLCGPNELTSKKLSMPSVSMSEAVQINQFLRKALSISDERAKKVVFSRIVFQVLENSRSALEKWFDDSHVSREIGFEYLTASFLDQHKGNPVKSLPVNPKDAEELVEHATRYVVRDVPDYTKSSVIEFDLLFKEVVEIHQRGSIYPSVFKYVAPSDYEDFFRLLINHQSANTSAIALSLVESFGMSFDIKSRKFFFRKVENERKYENFKELFQSFKDFLLIEIDENNQALRLAIEGVAVHYAIMNRIESNKYGSTLHSIESSVKKRLLKYTDPPRSLNENARGKFELLDEEGMTAIVDYCLARFAITENGSKRKPEPLDEVNIRNKLSSAFLALSNLFNRICLYPDEHGYKSYNEMGMAIEKRVRETLAEMVREQVPDYSPGIVK